MSERKKTHPGLVLTLGGAPTAPHTVAGLPGLYRPDRPTPVGGIGEATEEQAKAAHRDPGCPVKLVRIPDGGLAYYRKAAERDRRAELGIFDPEPTDPAPTVLDHDEQE